MKIMTIIFCVLTVLSASANSSTNVQVNECTQVISTQLLDILSQEKNVSYDDAQNNWTGYNQIILTGKTQSGLEQYKANINTGIELYKVEASVDSMCDVVDYKISNVSQCIETCYAYNELPRSELKFCVNACK